MIRLAMAMLLAASAPAWGSPSAGEFPPPSPELLQAPTKTPPLPPMHPPVILRDQAGQPVAQSGEPASAAHTCDGCHDVRWIRAHNLHGSEKDAPRVEKPGGNCFLCHVGNADNQARTKALQAGHPAWGDTATLAGTGLVTDAGEGWQWRRAVFAADGSVPAASLGLGRPNDRACGFCHGLVHQGPAPLLTMHDPGQRMTETQGVVFSGQRISEAALNIAGRDTLPRPWDVHAERMVACSNCHFSPNHPAYSYVGTAGLGHLQFDARRGEITEYLRRPDHQLATGAKMRRCEGCHDADKAHTWLPRAQRHFAALSCETCHVPAAHAPARQEIDRTMLTPARTARVVYRDVREDGFIEGFRPVLLSRAMPDGARKLSPYNLVTTWSWVEGSSGRPVPESTLVAAFFTDAGHRPELLAALDGNRDGKLEDRELVLDSQAKVNLARDLLARAGVQDPRIAGVVQAHDIHHGVAPGRFATRACETCHAPDSRLAEPFVLSSAVPFGVTPAWLGGSEKTALQVLRDERGQWVVKPALAGLHVLGHSGDRIIDILGLVVLLGTLAGAAGHALLRVRSARRMRKGQP